MTNMLDAALAYAQRGWPVFPCHPGRKDPLTAHGFKDATTDPGQIHAWWQQWPDANVAIATGAPGPDVLDFDIDPTAPTYDALAELHRAGVLAGHGAMIRTRSGGLHIYFTGSTQRSSSIRGRSVDFKAAGGYVLAPPSYVEADAKPAGHYQLAGDDRDPAAMLDWRIVRDILDPPPAFTQPKAETTALATSGRAGDDYAARTDWADILTPHGWRCVRTLPGGRRYWCRPGKTGSFISASTRDDGGLWVFSTNTEFDAEQLYSKFGAYTVLAGFGHDYAAAAAQLRKDGYGTPPAVPLTMLPPIPEASSDFNWWTPLAAKYTPIDWQKLFDETPEDEDWLIEPLLAAGRSVAIYSPPKAGKSLLTLEIVAALAAGRPVLGQPAGPPRRILYIDLENSRRDLRDRLTDLGYKPADLTNLIYLSFPALPALDSAEGGKEILALAFAHQAEAVVFDTVSRVIAGKENDADTFAALYRYALAPLKNQNIAVIRLDHAGKDATKGQRGSSAKNADVDAVWTLTANGPNITLKCEMSRTQLPAQQLTLRRHTSPLRHLPASGGDRISDLAAKLDELGQPTGVSKRAAAAALRKAGEQFSDAILLAAIDARKVRFDGGAGGAGGAQPPAPLPEPVRDITAPLHENTDSPVVRHPPHHPAPPPPGQRSEGARGTPPVGGGPPHHAEPQPPAAEPLCTRCGEYHHRYGDTGRPCYAQPAVTA